MKRYLSLFNIIVLQYVVMLLLEKDYLLIATY